MLRLTAFLMLSLLALPGCDPTAGGWAPPEQAVGTPEGLIDATDPQAITDIVARRDTGFWRRDGFRDPIIHAETAKIPWKVEFYGCENGADCTDLRFLARFAAKEGEPVKLARIADWNAENRFGKASIGPDGMAELEMNVVLAGGVTRQNFDLTLDWWLTSLSGFAASFDPNRKGLLERLSSG